MKKAQQGLARKARGSNRRKVAKRRVAKAHEKVRRQRKDFQFKATLLLVKKYDLLAIENLRPSEMKGPRPLNRSVGDAAWSQFLSILAFKAEEAGKRVVRVNPRNTSKACSVCGAIKEMPLKTRVYSCPSCGLELDRDVNAARNILARAGPAVDSSVTAQPRSVVR